MNSYEEKFNKAYILLEEVEVAGSFVYDGLEYLKRVDVDDPKHNVELFMANYNLAAGIERVLKVLFINIKNEAHENSHNSYEIYNDVKKESDVLNLTNKEEHVLEQLSKFYREVRYERLTYKPDEIMNNLSEFEFSINYDELAKLSHNIFRQVFEKIDKFTFKESHVYPRPKSKTDKLLQ